MTLIELISWICALLVVLLDTWLVWKEIERMNEKIATLEQRLENLEKTDARR